MKKLAGHSLSHCRDELHTRKSKQHNGVPKMEIIHFQTWVKVGVRYGLVYLWWLKGIHYVNPQNDRSTGVCVCVCTWSHSVATSPSKSCFSWITICFSSYSCSNCISNCLSYTQRAKRRGRTASLNELLYCPRQGFPPTAGRILISIKTSSSVEQHKKISRTK